MIISHNLTAMNAQRQLNIVGDYKKKSMEKLSSGYRVNRAADDAAGLTISEKMRSLINGLNQGVDNIQDGIGLTKIADGALSEIHDVLHREEELLIKAANGTNTEADKAAIQQELDQLNMELDRAFDSTEFNTIKIFKGNREIVGDATITSVTGAPIERSLAGTQKTETLVWLDKGVMPPPKTEETIDEEYPSQSVRTTVEDRRAGTDADGTELYFYKRTDIISNYETKKSTTITEEYINQVDQDYAKAAPPNVSNTGYMNFSTNGGIQLSCAMSQLAIDLSGDGLNFNSIDMCTDDSVKKTTVADGTDGYKTVYEIAVKNADDTDAVFEVIQIAKRNVAGNGYDISFSTNNNSDKQIDVKLKFALDTANTYGVSNTDNKSRANAAGDAADYTITGENFKATINSTGAKAAVLNSINELYGKGVGDIASIGTTYNDGGMLHDHTGLGVWYEQTVNAGNSTSLGGVTYDVEYIKDPYLFTRIEKVSDDSKEVRIDTTNTVSYQYRCKTLYIQCSNVVDDNIPIDLFNLSTELLGIRPGIDINVHDFGKSMLNINRVATKISRIRSYYGAMTNRLESAYNNNLNKAENTQAAESRIRDTDMAKEMVEFSKRNILEQAGLAMLEQANQSPQSVLSLLQ